MLELTPADENAATLDGSRIEESTPKKMRTLTSIR
jgi:hypothetical protein